jgi:N-dimethylarginine dimethylaminohydrolase
MQRTYLMCPPEYFTVTYSINAWMDTAVPVDTELAVKQWERLRETLAGLGHEVRVLTPRAGLPDQVYAASEVNEGEGDFAYLPGPGLILGGYGFRTVPAAHAQAQEVLGRPTVSLRLVDPRFYHLDTALAVLADDAVAYYPGAFSASSRRVLEQLFPDAVLADETDALAFGLNLVSDGRHVLLPAEATGMAARLAAAGYQPVPVELSELKKGGGSVKCCVAELRPAVVQA